MKGQYRQKNRGKDHGHGENSSKDVMGKNYMAWKNKRKETKKRKRKIMTISKDNKWMILSLLKLKDDELFPYGILEHSNPLLNS